MSRGRRAALVAWAALAISAGGIGCGGSPTHRTAPPAVSPSSTGTSFGFNQEVDALSIRLQAEIGARVRRFKVPWNEVEPGPGRWRWGPLDLQYRAMLRAGLKPLLLAIGAPCWTRPGRACVPGSPDSSYEGAWKEYVRRLTERYPRAIGVEVWNEENITPMWPPYPDPKAYTDLLRAASESVKEVNPKLPVISGGLFASDRTGPFGMADASFLEGMYAAGAGDSINAIGAHPYPITAPDTGVPRRYDLRAMEQALNRLRAVRDDTGHAGTPIWITETGVSTASATGYPPGATDDQQEQLLMRMVQAVRRSPDVQMLLIHDLVDASATVPTNPLAAIQSGFGVFDSSGRPKPAACGLSRLFGGSMSCGS